jgi:hypothetical protein
MNHRDTEAPRREFTTEYTKNTKGRQQAGKFKQGRKNTGPLSLLACSSFVFFVYFVVALFSVSLCLCGSNSFCW